VIDRWIRSFTQIINITCLLPKLASQVVGYTNCDLNCDDSSAYFFVLVALAVEIEYAYTQTGLVLYPECVLIHRNFAFSLFFLLKLHSKYLIRSSYILLTTPEFYC